MIRKELPGDAPEIRKVLVAAFGQADEADIVDSLRKSCEELLSLVAVEGDKIVGHALWSPAIIESDSSVSQGMGLGPVGVAPEHQRKGIGARLIKEGTNILRSRGCLFVIVLGHPDYYPRFGFVPAKRYDIKSEWDMPESAFMVLMLDPGQAAAIHGIAKYRPEFSIVR